MVFLSTIVWVTFLTILIAVGFWTEEKPKSKFQWRSTLIVGLVVVLMIAWGFVVDEISSKSAYKRALFDNPWDYKFVYEQSDSTYIVVDTIYFKNRQ